MSHTRIPEEIPYSEDALQVLQSLLKKNTDLWTRVSKSYSDTEVKLFDNTIEFTYRVVQTMGVVAGFGFAGISGVKNIVLFFTGEILILIGVFVGVYKIKIIFVKNLESVQSSSKNKGKLFERKSILIGKAMKDLMEEGKLKYHKFQKDLNSVDNDIAAEFGVGKELPKTKDESGFLIFMIFLFALGAVLLVSSFLQTEYYSWIPSFLGTLVQ